MNPPLQPPNAPVQNTPGEPAEDLIPGWLAFLGRSLLLALALALAAGLLLILHNALGSGEAGLSFRNFHRLFRRADEPLAYAAVVAFYLAFLGGIIWAVWTEGLPEAWRAFKNWRRIGAGNSRTETPHE